MTTTTKILQIKNLSIYSQANKLKIPLVRAINLELELGKTLCLIGESGSGKSLLNLSLLGLLPKNLIAKADECLIDGHDIDLSSLESCKSLRGKIISMIFQDPMTSFNPYYTIGSQILESVRVHQPLLSKAECHAVIIELLEQVGISEAQAYYHKYPHELSGGLLQRATIAMALAPNPKILIADEPTTALDSSTQFQILTLLRTLQAKRQMSVILVTHDMAVASQFSDSIQVLYSGECVEQGFSEHILNHAQHPYTYGLIKSIPHEYLPRKQALYSIPGQIPVLHQESKGCAFAPRCFRASEECLRSKPKAVKFNNTQVNCFHPIKEAV